MKTNNEIFLEKFEELDKLAQCHDYDNAVDYCRTYVPMGGVYESLFNELARLHIFRKMMKLGVSDSQITDSALKSQITLFETVEGLIEKGKKHAK